MLDKVKVALRLTTSAYNVELANLINACYADLKLTDIYKVDETDPLIIRAVILYCKLHFGYIDDKEAERFKAIYDELKASLSMNSNYTNWDGGANEQG